MGTYRSTPADPQRDSIAPSYLFLFEEPELYLHPNAQRILYSALADIAKEQQVVVSTHSPYFFAMDGPGTFIRLRRAEHIGAIPPVTEALSVDLANEISKRDAYQIICYESNSAAFFAQRVLLVEGESDVLFLTHLAALLNSAWSFEQCNIPIIRVGGNGNFPRYKTFFEAFGVSVRIIADLDTIIDRFSRLGADEQCTALHAQLIQKIDMALSASTPPTLNRAAVDRIVQERTFVQRYEDCKSIVDKLLQGEQLSAESAKTFQSLFAEEKQLHRRWALQNLKELEKDKYELYLAGDHRTPTP